MATIKKYIRPCITIVEISDSRMLCSSESDPWGYICNDRCKYWHICQDRYSGKACLDKKDKYK